MSQHSLNVQGNTSVNHNFSSRVWHESQSKIPSSYDLSKSTIKNIPGSKHSMGNNLEVVLLFQAAEIERLTENLQQLQNYKRQMERGPINLKSMQIQIKELTDEIHRNEVTLRELSQKYEAALQNLDQFEYSNQELHRKLQEKTLQNRELREELNEKDLTVSASIKAQDEREIYIKKLNDSIFFISRERDTLEEANQDYENKLALLSQEMMRLRESNNKLKSGSQITQKNLQNNRKQLQSYTQEIFELKSRLQREQLQNRQLNDMIEQMQSQIEQFKKTIIQLRDDLSKDQQNKAQRVQQLEQSIARWEKQNIELKEKNMALSQQSFEYKRLLEQLNNREQRNSRQMFGLQQENKSLHDALIQLQQDYRRTVAEKREVEYNFQSEKTVYSRQRHELEERQREQALQKQRQWEEKQNQVQILRRENKYLNSELQRVGQIVEQVNDDLETTRNQFFKNQNFLREKEGLLRKAQSRISNLEEENRRMQNQLDQKVEGFSGSIEKIISQKQTLKREKSELQRIVEVQSRQVRQRQNQVEILQRKVEQLQDKVEQFQRRNQQLQVNIRELQSQVDEQIRERRRLQKMVVQEKDQKRELMQQLNSKSITQSSINIRYEHLLNDIQRANQENNSLTRQLSSVAQEKQNLILENQKLSNQLRCLLDQAQAKNNHIESLRRDLQTENQKLSSTEHFLEKLRNQLQNTRNQLQETKNQNDQGYVLLREEKNKIVQKLQQKQDQISTLRLTNQQLQDKLSTLTHELERVALVLQEKQVLLRQKGESLRNSRQEIEKGELKEVQLKQEVRQLQRQLAQIQSEKDSLRIQLGSYHQSSTQREALEKKIEELRQTVNLKNQELVHSRQILFQMKEEVRLLSKKQQEILTAVQRKDNHVGADDFQKNLKNLFSELERFREDTRSNFEQVIQQTRAYQYQLNTSQDQTGSRLQSILQNTQQAHSRELRLEEQFHKVRDQIACFIREKQERVLTLQTQVTEWFQSREKQQFSFLSEQLGRLNLQQIKISEMLQFLLSLSQQQAEGWRDRRQNQISNLTQQLKVQGQKTHKLEKKCEQYRQEVASILQKTSEASRKVAELQRLHMEQITRIEAEKQSTLKQLALEVEEKRKLLDKINQLAQSRATLKEQNQNLKKIVTSIQIQVGQKKQQILELTEMVKKNNQEFISSHQEQVRHLKSELSQCLQENQKLKEILELRQQQLIQNQQLFQQIQLKLKTTEEENQNLRSLTAQVRTLQQKVAVLLEQKEYSQTQSEALQVHFEPLKSQVQELRDMNKNLHSRLQRALSKLGAVTNHIQTLKQQEASNVREIEELTKRLSQKQSSQLEGEKLREENAELLLKVQEQQASLVQLRIDHDYLQRQGKNNSVVLKTYEKKVGQLISESSQLENFFQKLVAQNEALKQENSEFTLELKKAQLCQNKIKVLNGEIDRLNALNIELDSQITEYRLQFSEESSMQRRCQEQLLLLVLTFSEIQSLRERLRAKQEEVQANQRSYRRSISSSRHY